MILILSKEQNEITTDEVMDWLQFYGQKHYRLNGEDLEEMHLKIDSETHETGDELLTKFKQADVIWFRRWYNTESLHYYDEIRPSNAVRLNTHIRGEAAILNNHLFSGFQHATWVDHPGRVGVSKLDVLRAASMCGLLIPETIITNRLSDVRDFLAKHRQIITKPLSEVLHLEHKNYKFLTHTRIITADNLHLLPERFFPSLFQKNIDKKIELRVFVLGESIHAMAIFSQNDAQTQEDFRNYNRVRPNRFIPYKLPEEIEARLLKLMAMLGLRTGSADLILTKENEYYFLEVNPGGQFSMVSKPCNYYLEKKMCEYLISLAPSS